MGIIVTYLHEGQDGGKWYAATYPSGVTRYYTSAEVRSNAVEAYAQAIRETGGFIGIAPA